ncbi:MAG: hypothetical protein M1839_000765 [Geoglossum umbratile]|nr:MAG: hypothetical protein M1839_000765 [Geoglossum umbratile]
MSLEESWTGWDASSFSQNPHTPVDQGSGRYFVADSRRLFALDADSLESLQVLADSNKLVSCFISDAHSLHNLMQVNKSKARESFYIIRQEYSWGRFKITWETFQMILKFQNVFTPFLDFVQAFGFKVDEDHKIWDGYHASFSGGLKVGVGYTRYELCYNIRYVEKNGRNSGDPWSLRQIGVYQQWKPDSRNSTWILLHPSENIHKRLHEIMGKMPLKSESPMLLHILFLSSTAYNWGDYIEDLRSQAVALDDKACFSRIGERPSHDYSVTFADTQKLQLLRQKLLRTLSVLGSCLAIAKGCESHCHKLGAPDTAGNDQVLLGLEIYTSRIKLHQSNVTAILQYSTGTTSLLSKIMEYRNNEVTTKTNEAMQDSLDVLSRIAVQSTRVTEQSQKDSRTLKALSLIATIYLPATFIAVTRILT